MKKLLFDNNKNVLADTIKLLRVKRGLSQQQVAAKMQTLGVSIDQQMISKIESNTRQVTDYELACFCLVLKTTPNEILADFYQQYTE